MDSRHLATNEEIPGSTPGRITNYLGLSNTLASSPPFHGGKPGSTPGSPTILIYINWLDSRSDKAEVLGSSPRVRTNYGSIAKAVTAAD